MSGFLALPAQAIINAAGVSGGLVVHVGCGDGQLTAALRVNDRYLGQETVARIDALGHVNRKLFGLPFDSAEVPARGDKLFVAEKEVDA
jgi:hypothetical protein